jgi:hypothetical protein
VFCGYTVVLVIRKATHKATSPLAKGNQRRKTVPSP